MRWVITAMVLLALSISGCGQGSTNDPDAPTGIRVSDWYPSEKYGRDIIDIINFDPIERTVNVTTICYDKEDNALPGNDTEILLIPPESQWTWVPVCPAGTISFSLSVLDLTKKK
ncbi:TPA: hypothetical protein HA361_05870 [Candidatus Woesearchaeota archaeon]|nr:hypothetical protein [Candidatus Woesearchaeota archaeon]HII69063.1 hypothetical protein [Candidatus Woesearchaeota archaeon]